MLSFWEPKSRSTRHACTVWIPPVVRLCVPGGRVGGRAGGGGPAARRGSGEGERDADRGRRRGPGTPHAGRGLLAQAELADDGEVTAAVPVAQIGEQAGALADHFEEAAPAGVVLLVLPHVLGQLVDACREQRDLHFRRAGVTALPPELVNNLRLAVLGDRHRAPLRPRPGPNSCRIVATLSASVLPASYQGRG